MLTVHRVCCTVLLLLLFLQLDVFVGARSFRLPPISSVTIIQDARIISWQMDPETVHFTSTFTLVFRLPFSDQENTQIRLSLEPNHDLIQDDAKVEHLDQNGNLVRIEPIVRHEHKIFKGQAYIRDEQTRQWRYCGWTRITILRDGSNPLFEGVFISDGDVHHIKLLANYNRDRELDDATVEFDDTEEKMVVYRDSDRFISQAQLFQRSVDGTASSYETNASICAHDRLEFNQQTWKRPNDLGFDLFRRLVRRQGSGDTGSGTTAGSRAQLAATIGNTAGCPNTRQVALVAAAADCAYVANMGNVSNTRSNIISIYNQASAVYEEQLNISLGLSNIVLGNDSCPTTAPSSALWNSACSSSFSMDNDLSVFSQWRGGRGNDGVALWTLLTGCSSGEEVGVAWLGMLCQYTAQTQGDQTVSGANVVGATQYQWQVLAHELGHGFGAYHDCTSQLCETSQTCCPLSASTCDASEQYIMNPTTMDATNRFSPCTIGNICSGFASKIVSTTCLTSNKNVTLITGGECGNGIVESGEECDCGGTQGCQHDPCCDPTTCKFTTGSVCDDANDECCTNCQFSPTTKVCHPSMDKACDPQQTCTGNSSACPKDITTPDGTKCGNGLYCASGSCTSRDLQCQQAIKGSTGACDDSSCTLSCSSTSMGPNTCLLIQQNFMDGTLCGFGQTGRCHNGQCEGQSTGAAIGNWIKNNKAIVIAIATVLGMLLLLCLASCIWRSCRRTKGSAFVPTNRQRAYIPPPPRRSLPPPPPPRQPSMAYYPQNPPSYGPPLRDTMANSGHAPPYAAPYVLPMRQNVNNGGGAREQQPGEEWVRGADGSFYPANQNNQFAPPRPLQPRRTRPYWE